MITLATFNLRILWTRGENVAKIFAFWGLLVSPFFLPVICHSDIFETTLPAQYRLNVHYKPVKTVVKNHSYSWSLFALLESPHIK